MSPSDEPERHVTRAQQVRITRRGQVAVRRPKPRRGAGLRTRVVVAMVVVAAVAVVLAGVVARQATRDSVTTVVDVAPTRAQLDQILDHRLDRGTWDGVEAVLERIDEAQGTRVIVTTPRRERVVGDSRPAEAIPPLVRLPHDVLQGAGQRFLVYSVAVEADTTVTDLAAIDRSFVVAGLVAIALATLVALLVAGPLTRPLRELAAALRRTRAGERDVRVLPGPGEIGELGTAFNDLADELARSEAGRRAMVADAAHELRTPLANLRGHLEAVVDGVVEPDATTMNGLIDDVERLGCLVDDLQSLALVESGVVRLELRPVAPDEVLRRAAAAQGAARGISTIVVTDGATLPPVLVDDVRMPQVFDNLLANAARHAETVRLSARSAGAAVELVVADDGPGIPDDQLEAVFERFHRTDPSRGSWAGGAGLGLAITRRLVELHGGTIRAEHTPGGGATFVVRLPAARPAQP